MSEQINDGKNVVHVVHLGEVGRFFDDLGDVGTIVRPRSVPWSRRTIVFMPRWYYVVALLFAGGAGVLLGINL